MQNYEYERMKDIFEKCFEQELSDYEITHKKGGIIGDEAMPLGKYIWDERNNFIEYYVSWLPHYRGDSHGRIYKDGRHEHLDILPQIGKVTPEEIALRKQLEEKGLLNIWA